MRETFLSGADGSRRLPLAACIASLFSLSAPSLATAANTWPVTSCADDGGPTTLRGVIAAVTTQSGDTVDLSGLTGLNACAGSKITLATGHVPDNILIIQNDLTIKGPVTPTLTIDATNLPHSEYVDSRVFYHSGNGKLTIQNLGVANGYVSHNSLPARGGCIYSKGDVELDNAYVSHCGVAIVESGPSERALGGGVFATGNLTLSKSTLSHNTASVNVGGTDARGAGAYVKGNLILDGGGAAYNSASTTSGNSAGGGAFVQGDLTLTGSSGKYIPRFGHNSATSVSGTAKGGGAYVLGTLDTNGLNLVYYNSAVSTNGTTRGGGLYAKGSVTLHSSIVANNYATGHASYGGGANVAGDFSASYSSIKYNKSTGGTSDSLAGGLLLSGSNNTIAACTISGNAADGSYGAIDVFRDPGTGATFQLSNSTISGNTAGSAVGGLYSNSVNTRIYNSTIAFNTSVNFAPGVLVSASSASIAATLKSNVIAYNTYGASENDLYFRIQDPNTITVNGGNLAAAAKNLIGVTSVASSELPDDTLFGNCPRLGPLRDNGGPTFTHALLSGSPAIDNGNDSFGALYDQRGSAATNGDRNYTRFSGLTAIADIGAYEVQQNDIVFNTNFEGCPFQ